MAVAVPLDVAPAVPRAVLDVLATIPEWWARRAHAAGLPPRSADWRILSSEPPVALSGSPLVGLEVADAAEVGAAYAGALDPATRLREGRHYTPAGLAAELWHEIVAAGEDAGPTVDPACGAGALLLAPLRRLVRSSDEPTAILAAAQHLISGTDLDQIAVWLGNALLSAELLPLWARLPEAERRPLPQFLRVADGLSSTAESPRIIIMNPPYGRVRLETSARARWQGSLYGHANRYALFLHAAIERVAQDGVVGAIIPTSFLGGAYYKRLRSFIDEHAPLIRLAFVDSRSGVFAGDVLQETCLAVFRKGAAPGPIVCSRLAVNGTVESTRLPTAPKRRRSDLPWLLPRKPTDDNLLTAASRLDARLSDYGWKASTGPLVWNRHKAQIFRSARPGRTPILWAADIDDGVVTRHSAREHQRWIALRSRDSFMKIDQPGVLVQRTTAPEQPRRLVAALLDPPTIAQWGGELVIENHVNVMRCSDPESPLSPGLLTNLVRTPTFDRLFRCLSGTVAVSAYELEALPLPPPDTLRAWETIPAEELASAVARFYGDAAA